MSVSENASVTENTYFADDDATTTDQPLKKDVSGKKASVQIMDPPVTETRGYSGSGYVGLTVVKVEEKHGPLYWAIPTMPLPVAIVCCVLNIVVPGLGE